MVFGSFRINFCFFFRTSHAKSGQKYTCVSCKSTFSSWRNFKRHRQSKHGEKDSFTCPHCEYDTDRKDNLSRHIKTEHSIYKLVSSLLDESLTNLKDENGLKETHEVSPYEKARNERVAQIEAEFRKQFPLFEQEVMSLGYKNKNKKKKSPHSANGMGRKRSSRLNVPELLPKDAPHVEVPDELHVGPAGESGRGRSVSSGNGSGLGQGSSVASEEGSVSGEGCSVSIGEGFSLGEGRSVSGGESSGLSGESCAAGSSVQTGGASVSVEENLDDRDLGMFGCLPCEMKFRDNANLIRHVELVHKARKHPVKCPRHRCNAEFLILKEMWAHKNLCMKVCPYPDCKKTFIRQDKFASHERYHLVLARRMKD